jgi:hypothetical protein
VHVSVVDSLFVAISLSIYVEMEVDSDWLRGISFGSSGYRDIGLWGYIVKVAVSDLRLAWKMSRGRTLVGVSSDGPLLVRGCAV